MAEETGRVQPAPVGAQRPEASKKPALGEAETPWHPGGWRVEGEEGPAGRRGNVTGKELRVDHKRFVRPALWALGGVPGAGLQPDGLGRSLATG